MKWLPILGVAAAAAAGVAAVTMWPADGDAARAPAAPADAAPPAVPPSGASPVVAAGPIDVAKKPAADPAARARQLELPDGTFVPALNGAVDPAPLSRYWGQFPWSPITGVEKNSAGVDWYRHADGSYSTTQMVWRQDLGREAAMTRVAHPGPTVPVAPASQAR